MLANDCHVTEEDSVEELDCSVGLYKRLRRNGYQTIGQITAQNGKTFFDMDSMSMRQLHELFEQLDFLGFRLADWKRNTPVKDYYEPFRAADRKRWEEQICTEQ